MIDPLILLFNRGGPRFPMGRPPWGPTARMREVDDFDRADGRAICRRCGHEFQDHRYDLDELGYGGQPFLHVLCGGRRVKL